MSPAGPVLPAAAQRPLVASPCPVTPTDDVVVCARPSDTYRARPLPPLPDRGSALSHPIRIQLAPGVALGSTTGGIGLSIAFGPGRKSGGEEVDRDRQRAKQRPSDSRAVLLGP